MGRTYNHTCERCGKLFVSKSGNTQYCSQVCRTRAAEARRRAERQAKYDNRPKANKDLDRVAAEANAAGMTYGKYVAKMRGERR